MKVRSHTSFIVRASQICLATATFVASASLAGQARVQDVGIAFGTIKGVPGLTDRKWGPVIGVRFAAGGSVLRLVLEGDYVFIRSAASCCGPPGGFTYDDHGALAMVGPELTFGSERLHIGLTTEVGVEEYREVRRGSVPGFNPSPDRWHGQAVGNFGVSVTQDVTATLSATLSAREYASLSNAAVGGFHPQPSLSLGLSWHPHRLITHEEDRRE